MGNLNNARFPLRIGHIFLALATLFAWLGHANAYIELEDDALRAIPSGDDGFDIQSGHLLSPILVPRVPGTPGSVKAQEHFMNYFKQYLPSWAIEWHNSTSKTPATGDKEIPFANLIFRRDPPWAKSGDVARLTLVAHYDSLYHPEGFIGAIDSAAPCAMLLQAAKGIEDSLTKKWEEMQANEDTGMGLNEEVGIQILLLDGEEAWVAWTADDSLYGSRALAESWESEPHPAMSIFKNQLNSISLFVLLDLLGSKNPHVPSYFLTTHWAYQNMAKVEYRLRKLGLFESKGDSPFLPDTEKMANQFRRGFVEDDHVPFMARGVDILHIIPTPFPPVWHKMEDDGEHLDLPTVRDWTRIVTAFAAEWLELGEHLPRTTETLLKRETEKYRTEL